MNVGDKVKAGQELMVLESMKMEIPILAPADGTITHVLLDSGQGVRAGQPLVVLSEHP